MWKLCCENSSEQTYSGTDHRDTFGHQHQAILPTQSSQEMATHMLLNWAPGETETQWLTPNASAEGEGGFLWHIKRSLMYNVWQVKPIGDSRLPTESRTDREQILGKLSESTVKGPCRNTKALGHSFNTLWLKSPCWQVAAINSEIGHRNLNLTHCTNDK